MSERADICGIANVFQGGIASGAVPRFNSTHSSVVLVPLGYGVVLWTITYVLCLCCFSIDDSVDLL